MVPKGSSIDIYYLQFEEGVTPQVIRATSPLNAVIAGYRKAFSLGKKQFKVYDATELVIYSGNTYQY